MCSECEPCNTENQSSSVVSVDSGGFPTERREIRGDFLAWSRKVNDQGYCWYLGFNNIFIQVMNGIHKTNLFRSKLAIQFCAGISWILNIFWLAANTYKKFWSFTSGDRQWIKERKVIITILFYRGGGGRKKSNHLLILWGLPKLYMLTTSVKMGISHD